MAVLEEGHQDCDWDENQYLGGSSIRFHINIFQVSYTPSEPSQKQVCKIPFQPFQYRKDNPLFLVKVKFYSLLLKELSHSPSFTCIQSNIPISTALPASRLQMVATTEVQGNLPFPSISLLGFLHLCDEGFPPLIRKALHDKEQIYFSSFAVWSKGALQQQCYHIPVLKSSFYPFSFTQKRMNSILVLFVALLIFSEERLQN